MSKTFLTIINNSAQEVIKNAGVTEKLQFMDEFTNPVPEGIPYHIHITTEKNYFYMTSNEHESNSIVIFRNDGNDSDYVKYRKLVGSENQKYLTESRTAPTPINYENGYVTLFFARQANDIDAKVFEISKDDYSLKTPFYIKTSVTLKITGDKRSAQLNNARLILRADTILRGLNIVVTPLQYFKTDKDTKQSVQDRLKNYKQVIPSSTSGGSSGGSSGGGGY